MLSNFLITTQAAGAYLCPPTQEKLENLASKVTFINIVEHCLSTGVTSFHSSESCLHCSIGFVRTVLVLSGRFFFGPYPFKLVLQLFLPIPRRRLLRPVQQTFSSLQMVRSPVGPQTHLIAESRESFDFLVHCQVFWGDVPVSILEIRTGRKLGLVSAREEADLQIRKRLRDLNFDWYLPTFQAPCGQRNRHQIVFLYC